MKLDLSNYSIAEIRDMLSRRDLEVNREYQRGAGLWPSGPRSYFIDSILMNFPFPKLYFYEYLERASRRTKREIVDGQQRITAIIDFLDGKFKLTDASKSFAGLRFEDLEDDTQEQFLSYSVPVDVIRNAERHEILEMFRRMNAYTLPLNEAEKRHSTFYGAFKWSINRWVDEISPVLVEFEIFTNRQIVRMADAELVADIVLAIEQGIVSTTNKRLSDLYQKYDGDFPRAEDYWNRIREAFAFVANGLGELRGSYLMKPYVVHSLILALLHNKAGLPGVEEKIQLWPIGEMTTDLQSAREGLAVLARAHETEDIVGPYAEYVRACSGGANRETQRAVRVQFLALALRGELLKT